MILKLLFIWLHCGLSEQFETSGDGNLIDIESSSGSDLLLDLFPLKEESVRSEIIIEEIIKEEEIAVEFVAPSGEEIRETIVIETLPSNATNHYSQNIEEAGNNTTMLVIGLAAGLGALLVMVLLMIATCCVIHKRREERNNVSTVIKRPAEANPVEQTFERVVFNRDLNGSRKFEKKSIGNTGDQTVSELAPSSMGTMRTFVQISNQKPVSHIAIDSDFRNTSSDVDSIESSNATSNLAHKPTILAQVIEKKATVAKVNTYGYQELPTREISSHYSTSSSSQSENKDHKNAASYDMPYETITRSKDSVINL